MGLKSRLFSGDPALEACLMQDSAHVLQGASGGHVAKIQAALFRLDGLEIDAQELETRKFGPSTAAAVLAFKKQRKIINLSYQTQADNIVGKMTIAAMDSEMLAKEDRRPTCLHCGDPVCSSGRGKVGASVFAAPSFMKAPGFTFSEAGAPRFPATLEILWQPSRAAVTRGALRLLPYVAKATELLSRFGMTIMMQPPDAFPHDGVIDPRFREDIGRVRIAAEKHRPGFANALRVIICPFESGSAEFGITEGGDFGGQSFRDFILLNVNRLRDDRCTMIHEMIHATGLFKHDTEPESVFSGEPARSVLMADHAQRLSKAFFAR